MLRQKCTTHKNHKITTLAITDSYKQLFVLITVLLTILNLQPTIILTMAAPLEPHRTYRHYFLHTHRQQQQQHQQQLQLTQLQHTQLHEILLAERRRYDHDNYINNHRQQKQQQQLQQQQQLLIETDLNKNLKKSKANIIENDHSEDDDRLRKREISWHEYYNRIMQSQAINWYNPCGGISLRNATPVKRKRPPLIKKELRIFQLTVAKNYNFIKHLKNSSTIYIRDMNEMEYFEKKYTFLPKLNVNSSISLRRWHRQLQIYVAAFEYLRRAELNFNNMKTSQESSIAQELNKLMINARTILCNIEHAINNTTTRRSFTTIDALFISRTKMEGILKFTTDIKYVSPLRWNQIKDDMTLKLVDPIDLKFAKSYYLSFVRKLLKILRTHTKQKGPMYLGKRANKMQNVQEQQHQQQTVQRMDKQKKQQIEHRPQQQQKKRKNSQTTKIRHSSRKKLESVLN